MTPTGGALGPDLLDPDPPILSPEQRAQRGRDQRRDLIRAIATCITHGAEDVVPMLVDRGPE